VGISQTLSALPARHILSEELNWLRGDLQAVVEVVVSPKGRAEPSRVVEMTPRDVRVAQEFGALLCEVPPKGQVSRPAERKNAEHGQAHGALPCQPYTGGGPQVRVQAHDRSDKLGQ
jgi:hypothetical protein